MGIEKSIKKARFELRLTQADLSVTLSCSRDSVINWESGKTEPGFKVIRKLAALLKIKPSKLVSWGE